MRREILAHLTILTNRWPSLSWWNIWDLPLYVLRAYLSVARELLTS